MMTGMIETSDPAIDHGEEHLAAAAGGRRRVPLREARR